MHATVSLELAALEIGTAAAYFLIALGFALRWLLIGRTPPLLFPPVLVAIFVLCGTTRAMAFVPFESSPFVAGVLHGTLFLAAAVYAAAQLVETVCEAGVNSVRTDATAGGSDAAEASAH
jgi:hypothetical protein